MKRSLAALCLLAALTLGTLAGAHLWVNAARDRMALRETVLAGDSAAGAGVTVTYRIQGLEGHLRWEMAFSPGGTPETAFRFDPEKQAPDMSWAFEPYGELNYNLSTIGIQSYTGLVLPQSGAEFLMTVAYEIQERTGAGETRTETLPMDSYRPYYPLLFQARWQGLSDSFDSSVNGNLARYFRIPVPPEQTVEVSVTKDDSGAVTAVSARFSKDMPALWSESAVCAEGVYLVAGAPAADGTDALECPDGPGVHFVPCREDAYPWFDLSGLRLFYPAEHALNIRLSEDGSRLLLYTREAGKLVLTVLDRGTGEALERLELLEMGAEEKLLEPLDSGPLHLTALSGGAFCLVWEEEQGAARVLTGSMDPDDTAYRRLLHSGQALAWDGARMFWGASDWYGADLGVWDARGLQFLARYEPGPVWDPGWASSIYGQSAAPLSFSLG